MENLFFIGNIVFAILLIIVVLLQRSEGGALGIGVSQDSYISSRSTGNLLTKATSVIATLFIITSISLTILSKKDLPTRSVIDNSQEEKDNSLPEIPATNE